MTELNRRQILRNSVEVTTGTLGTLVLGCNVESGFKAKVLPSVLPTPERVEDLQRIRTEVQRIATMAFAKDPLSRMVYLGDLWQISPIYASPLNIGITDQTYARAVHGKTEYSGQKRFSYYLERDGLLKDYETLKSMEVSVLFSPFWLRARDEVKILAMEKEAITIGQFEGVSRITLNSYASQGRIEKIDPWVTDEEIARTLARNLILLNSEVHKMYDYAAYLPILARVGLLLEKGDMQVKQDLSVPNLTIIYSMAKGRGVPFQNIIFGTREFYDLAFNPQSPWVKMILEPSVPGPVSF